MKYYEINEVNAQRSHEMSYSSDYKHGSATDAYQDDVDKAYALAAKVAEVRPDDAERAEYYADRYARRMAEYYNRESSIGMMCPSVLISGAANFPTRKKERQIAAWDRNHTFWEDTQKILDKLDRMARGTGPILSSDAHALEKLQDKLAELKAAQARMVAANKALRLKDVDASDGALYELGYTDFEIEKLREPYLGRIGYSSYTLSNNNANIHRVEKRIRDLEAAQDGGSSEQDFEGFKAVKNTDIMRYQIIFPGKPDDDTRALLKSECFKWAPSQKAWQRQITFSGERAFKRVIEALSRTE